MRKFIITLIVFAFVSFNSFSQVEIDNAGNVGIGIATPTQQLDVNGILRVRNIPLDNSLQQVLVQDPIGNVHFRDFATFSNWIKNGDSLYSDSLCLVGIGTASPLQRLHVNGITRTQVGNALFDIWPIPGPPLGIGGGVDLIFNKDNVCIGLFRWEEKIFIPIPTLPDPVFKLFPRTGGLTSSAPGFELATFGTLGLGLDGIRMMLCPSTIGPFPLWDNPRIDLKILNEIEINPGGATGGLTVSNIGSSGQDGVSIEIPEDEFRFATKDSATAKVAEVKIVPDFPAESFFDVTYDVFPYHRMRLRTIDDGIRTGTGLVLGESQLIEGATNIGGSGGRIAIYPKDSAGHDHLTISNIGSSGQDGVRMALTEPIQTEIISLDLVSSAPLFIPAVRHGTNDLVTQYEYDGLNRLVRRTYADTSSSSTATPHRYTYDGLNNRILESIPPLRIQSHDSLITTYSYDPLGRRIISRYEDLSTSTTAQPLQYEYDAINRMVRTTGPRTLEYTHNGDLRHTSLYNPAPIARTITETWDGLLPGEQPQTMEFDFLANQMRLIAGQVVVLGDFDVTGIVGGAVKAFKIDHPLDPFNKNLMHVSVESPDMMNIYNGNIITDKDGNAIVEMPNYFTALNMDFRYQLTTIGQQAQAWIATEISKNVFKIKTDKPNVKVSWQVTGIRNDTYARENRVEVEVEKDERLKGKLLYKPRNDLGLNR